MRTRFKIPILLLFIAAGSNAAAFQGGERTSPAAPKTPTKSSTPRTFRGTRSPRKSGSETPKIPPTGSLDLTIIPADSTVELDNQPATVDPTSGLLNVKTIAAGQHNLWVRRTGYHERQELIDVEAGKRLTLTISLDVLKGALTVRPSVDGSSLELRNVDQNQPVGSYAGAIDHIEFPPGEYELTISKPGYVTTTRSIRINAGASVEMEPRLDPLPPTPPPRPVRHDMSGRVQLDGKYLIVYLSGASQDNSASLGSINVTASKNGSGFPDIDGSLNGMPCRIEFFKIENVDEWSLVETPSPSNQYSRVVVRVRPKDSKRPLRFAINWKSVTSENTNTSFRENVPGDFVEAVPTYKARPEYPAAARSSKTLGIVSVNVAIDEMGNVVSAKATDGPTVLRQSAENAARQWRFRPATRNGKPVPTMQVIRFNFEK